MPFSGLLNLQSPAPQPSSPFPSIIPTFGSPSLREFLRSSPVSFLSPATRLQSCLASPAPFPSPWLLCSRGLSHHIGRVPKPPLPPPPRFCPFAPAPLSPTSTLRHSFPFLPPAPVHSQEAGAGGADEAAHGDVHVGDPALGALEAVTVPGLAAAAQLPHPATPHLRSRLRLRLSPADPATRSWALLRCHHHGCPLPQTSSLQISKRPFNHCRLPASSVASARSASLTEAPEPAASARDSSTPSLAYTAHWLASLLPPPVSDWSDFRRPHLAVAANATPHCLQTSGLSHWLAEILAEKTVRALSLSPPSLATASTAARLPDSIGESSKLGLRCQLWLAVEAAKLAPELE